MNRVTATKKLNALVFAGIIVLLALFFYENILLIFLLYNAVIFGLFITDCVISPKTGDLIISRVQDGPLMYKSENEIMLSVKNNGRKKIKLELKDDLPAHFKIIAKNMIKTVLPGGEEIFSYAAEPMKRGLFVFEKIFTRYDGALGLCKIYAEINLPAEMRAYPNANVSGHRILAHKYGAGEKTAKTVMPGGAGSEFAGLREYVSGDDYRKINWPATARELRPMTNLYETEKNRQVYIMLDAGRAMGGQIKFDRAVNAAIILTDIVIESGDNAGLVIFNENAVKIVTPGKGPAQRNSIMDALYAAEASGMISDYDKAFYELVRQKRRGLVFIFTDFETEAEVEFLLDKIPLLKKRHLPVIVLPENEGARELAAAHAREMKTAYAKGLAIECLNKRKEMIKKINASGVICVETAAERFASEAVNRYIKLRGR